MRVIKRVLTATVAVSFLGAASTADAAWRFEKNGPHAWATKKPPASSGATSASKSPTSPAPRYAPECKRRRSTVKPFLKYCVRSDSTSR